MRRIFTALVAISMLGITALPTAQADTLRVPKTTWPLCSDLRPTFCVESVSVQPIGAKAAVPLTWAASGKFLVSPDTTTVTDTATVVDTSTAAVKAPAGVALAGMWSHEQWSTLGLAYDGMLIDVKTANEFTNTIFMNVVPVVQDASGKTAKAVQSSGSVYATDLNPDVTVSVKLRVGNFATGVTLGAGQNVTVDTAGSATDRTFTITGEPSRVPLASKPADCQDETGKAVAIVSQLQAFLFPTNDTAGFGIDGVSGDMYVASNGLCTLSTPVWIADTKEMVWTASAPHFAPDGATINRGFYKAIIPAADAKLLWGLDNANDAASALIVSVTDQGGDQVAAQTNVLVKNNRIIIDASGFMFSSPKLHIKKNPKYVAKAATPAKQKTSTIVCKKGAKTKKVTGNKPVCPKGWAKTK